MNTIAYDDFAKVEIRVGTVVAASVPEGSKKVIRLTVDFGEEQPRVIFSGIKEWYAPEDLVGKQLPFIVNLPPKKMGDLGESQGMLMAAVPEAGETHGCVLLLLDKPVPEGTKVV